MTIDEQVRDFMDLWAYGVRVSHECGPAAPERLMRTEWSAEERQAVFDGRAAYLAAEQAERERLEREQRCPACNGRSRVYTGEARGASEPCPACRGTGRRP